MVRIFRWCDSWNDAACAPLCDVPSSGQRHSRIRNRRRAGTSRRNKKTGAIFGGVIAILGVWILFKTQLDILEGMTRAITDILWTGSKRIRVWRGGDVRMIYYGVLTVVSLWGIVALRLTQPIVHWR
jgi:hypothetical protein